MDPDYDWTYLLAEQLDGWWRVQLRPRMDGLTDEEYHWEPVPGMWGIRPRGTSTAQIAAGTGGFTADFAFPEPDPPGRGLPDVRLPRRRRLRA